MAPARIMVVEYESIVALDLKSKLERLGYDVVTSAGRGDDVPRQAGDTRPDLVLMDITVRGGFDGVAAAGQIRTRYNLPVVYLTAHSDPDTLDRAKVTEPYGYILKPFQERELHATIEIALYKHRAEEELRRHREHLEELLRARTAELIRANEYLQQEIGERQRMERELIRLERLRALEELSGGISHNLNNLLTGILGPAELLRTGSDDPVILEQTAVITESARRARDLVLRLTHALHANRESGLSSVPVNELVQQAIEATRPRWRDEATRLRVFEPFFTTKTDVGTGLGLATVHGAVMRWGGRIDVESAPGQGTRFTLHLPRWAEPARPDGEAGSAGSARARLLIVEDEEVVSRLLSQALSQTCDIAAVANGTDAVAQLVPGRLDVALIDLGIPGMPGDQVARHLERVDPGVVRVLVTGWELGPDDPRLELFDYLIRKPFELSEVHRVVARAMEQRVAGVTGNAQC